jgi:hypothetical protein
MADDVATRFNDFEKRILITNFTASENQKRKQPSEAYV